MKERIFISSAQRELSAERRALRDFVRGDPLLSQYFEVFLFEDLPACDGTPDKTYLAEVDRSAIYLGLIGNEYGWEDQEGISPTEREFDRATLRRRERLVFIKGTDDGARHEKTKAFVRKVERQLTRRRFVDVADLSGKAYASLIRHLEMRGVLPTRPFHAAACPRATLRDIDPGRIAWFLKRARKERQLALSARATPKEALTSLNLLDGSVPTRAAVLLFGKNPQSFLPTAEIKCLHLHGTTLAKPIPSYQVFKGTLFEQVDEAVDFVMAKLGRRVGARAEGPAAPVEYELPREVLAEAIVNAVAHRDYASASAVQVYVFADRVEIWNPGELPPSLTPASLWQQHPSLPHNPLIAEALFLAHYIEKVGSGTLDVISGCQRAQLPEPEFFQDGDQFVLRLWREWLTADVLAGIDLNDRQRRVLMHLKVARTIGNTAYQERFGVSKRTAHRDLADLMDKGLLERQGTTGKGTGYVLRKGVAKGPNGPDAPTPAQGAAKGPKGPAGRAAVTKRRARP